MLHIRSAAAADGAAEHGRGRQLPRHARARADDLDAARLRRHALAAAQVRLPAHPGGARQAPAGDRGGDRRRPSAPKAEADELLAEYRERLQEAREQAEDIVARARKAAEEHERESLEAARQQREELLEQTRRDIEAETRRAIQEIRNEVADLTVLATEKVTRKTLTAEDQQRLVEEALGESTSRRSRGSERRGQVAGGGDRTGLLALAVRGRQGARQARPRSSDELAEFADALEQNRELAVFFFSPLLLDRGEGGRAAPRGRGRGPDARRTSSSC